MKTQLTTLLCSLLLGSSVARADANAGAYIAISTNQAPGYAPAQLQPLLPAPTMHPPVMPAQLPYPPVQAQARRLLVPPVAINPVPSAGQWVYTDLYGWVWMPYGDQYAYAGTVPGSSPYAYVYYPSRGWTWLAAPWILGGGAYPYFGVRGALGFGWYRGLYRTGHAWGGYHGGQAYRVGPGLGGGYHSANVFRGGAHTPSGGRAYGVTGGGPRFGGGAHRVPGGGHGGGRR